MDELHPYDGRERRFRHDDADAAQRERGRELVGRLLELPEPPREAGLRYDLSFYSGGIGVLDRLCVVMPCTPTEVDAIVAQLGMLDVEALLAHEDEDVREAFAWLVLDDEHPDRSHRAAVATFVEEHRAAFQPSPHQGMRAWSTSDSGVNAWSLVYEVEGELAFIGYDQG